MPNTRTNWSDHDQFESVGPETRNAVSVASDGRGKKFKEKFARVRKALGKLPHLKMSFGSPNEAYLQTYLSRGDRSVHDFFKTYLSNGHDAKSALKKHAVDSFVYRQYGKEDYLPWDIVDHGYRNGFYGMIISAA